MKKNAKRFLSMLLALSMVFSLVVIPAGATGTHSHDHGNAAGANTASTNGNYDFSVEDFSDVVPLKTEGVELDKENPAIIAVEKELQDMLVLNAEGEAVPLTTEEIQQILGFFQQYLDQWEANANLLGVQVPFFLQYNDKEKDGLGILGEMLALAGVPVAAVRAGQMKKDDLMGMIMNFYYGDQLGLKFYGSVMTAKRDEVMNLIANSGAKTEAQKLLVLNDWLAHNVTFDMPYIMNTDKDTNGDGVINENDNNVDSMVAENPQEHENYKNVYDVMFAVYEAQIRDTFEGQIVNGLKAEFMYQYYLGALEKTLPDLYTAGAISEEAKAEEIVAAVKGEHWDKVFAEAKEAEEQKVYDEAYNDYLSKNHVHAYITSTWTWTEEEDGTWSATVTITCTEGGEVYENVAADVVVAEGEPLTWAPTCTEAGQTTYIATATIKDANDVEESFTTTTAIPVAALGHNYDPETGVCTVCRAISTEHVHEFETNAVYAWSKDDDGNYVAHLTTSCTTCAMPFTNLAASSITKDENSSVTATCNNAGADVMIATFILEDANGKTIASLTDSEVFAINALGHTPGAEATCTTAQICTACNVTLVGALGHTPGAEATCTTAQICTVCEVELAPVLDHTPGAAATCTAAQTCTVCGVELTPALDHTPGAEATCTTAQICTVCEVELVPALDHTPGAAATCTTAQICTVCEVELAPALDHTWDDGVVTTEPTEGSEGVKTFTCSVCNETKTEAIPALEHVHNYTAAVTEPTCTEAGFTTRTCACGDVYTDEAVAALGHDEQIDIVAATCGADGLKTTTCSRCDYKNEEVLTATGEHADTDDDGMCDACAKEIPVVEDEDNSNTVGATDEEIAAAETYAENQVVVKASEIEAAAKAAADEAVAAMTEEQIQPRAEEIVKSNPDAMAAIKTQVDALVESDLDAYTAFVKPDGATITGNPVEFIDSMELLQIEVPVTDENGNYIIGEDGNPVMMTIAQQLHAGWDQFWAGCETNGIPGMVAMFSGEIWPAVIKQFYIQGMMQEYGMDEATAAAQAEQIMEADKDAIAADPYAYCVEKFGEEGAAQAQAVVNDQLKQMGIDGSAETNPEGRVKLEVIVALQMDTPQQDPMLQKPDGSYMTPNEAIPVFADQAAVGLTDGILNYWQGSHIGALGRGTAVCLGYTKAFTYLVQYMHPEIYGINGANTDMSQSANWKKAAKLYYDEEGNLDINANYIVDDVRITFDADVTMYGVTQENFNSDHFWNAIKVDGEWYYADPCYTDVYTEVMIRDRVETDGSMNHMYFIFSHTTAAKLYDGYYSEIKTLYDAVSTNTNYEDSWISRIKSNTYFNGGYAYYIYDSTDLITLMDDYNESQNNNNNNMDMSAMTDNKLKLVRHKLTNTDSGDDGDTNYETLIEFNYQPDEGADETVARVYDPTSAKMVENVLLTNLYAQHTEFASKYPSLAITMGLYNGKAYFNIANAIVSYDIATGAVTLVKEYNTVYGLRDKTNPFGGMAFSVSDSNNYDFKIENHPIAAMTIKNDGKMYVSIATNFAFISGKDPHNSEDQSSFGYEFEESNFNPNYNSYGQDDYDNDMYESMGYTKEINDNDEFMWSANFVDTVNMSHLAGTSHNYASVTVAPFCGRNGYTENRCSTCGAIEADTRVEEEGTALEKHHYVKFEEEFYTKNDNGNWNTGVCYVCTVCGFCITEPKEPVKNDYISDEDFQKQVEQYEKELAMYEEAVEIAGHTYVPTDAVWAEDDSTVTFSILECSSVCPERKGIVDCLLKDDTIKVELEEALTVETSVIGAIGSCVDGAILLVGVEGELEVEFIQDKPETISYLIYKEVPQEPGDHNFENCVCTVCGEFTVKRIFGDGRSETAIATADALKAKLGVEDFTSIIIANGDNFADALAGSYLATVKGAPILLRRNSGVGDDLNFDYISANLAEDGVVYLLGGTAVIPESVEKALVEADYEVVRLYGENRLETNLKILEEAGVEKAEEILVTTGWEFADCLSASATGRPIMMVNGITGKLSDSQIAFLKANADKKFIIIGGNKAVNDELEAAIAEIVSTDIERVYGDSREETSVKVAERFFDAEALEYAFVAYSRNFPDGLCGGPLANAYGAPLLLINTGKENFAADYVAANGIEAGFIMGGTGVVSDASAKTVFGIVVEEPIPAL